MRPSTPFTLEKSFYQLSCVLIFVLLIIKAKTMSMTHDESSSFFYLNDKNVFFDLFDKNAWPNANNHWLNTILFQISSRLFGPSELAIRLPNVLSFILYAVFSIKLIGEVSHKVLRVLIFSIVITNSYLLDFFSTARGYGIGLAFTMVGLYYFYKLSASASIRYKYVLIGSLAFLLSTLSLFSNALLYLSACLSLMLMFFLNGEMPKYQKIKSLIIVALFLIITFLLIATPLMALSGNEEFKWGTNSLTESLASFYSNFGYSKWYFPNGLYLAGFISGIIITGLFKKLTPNIKFKNIKISFANYILFFVIIFISGMVLSKLIFGTLYPLDRKTIIYFPMLGLLLGTLFDIDTENKLKNGVIFFTSCLVLTHFIFTFSISSTREWWYDAGTKKMVNIIVNDGNQSKTKSVGCHWFFYHTINHYSKSVFGYKIMLHPYNKNIDADGSYDYFVCFDSDMKALENKYTLMYRDVSGRVILKRK